MEAAEVVRRLHRHRIWSNGRLLDACRALSREQLEAPFAIGQGSVWASLVHLLAADALWLDAFTGRPDSPAPVAGDFGGPDELAERWGQLDRRWQEVLAGLDNGQLERPVRRADLEGKLYAFDGLDAHLQVCTHAAYTAAQVVNMLRHLGVAPLPNCMLVVMSHGEGRVTELPVRAGDAAGA